MTILTMLVGLSMLFWVPMLAQTADSTPNNAPVHVERKDSLLLSRLGNTRIIFKDGSIRENCKVKEIHDYWIVYAKEGSLHDVMIDKIARIEMEDKISALYFDEKNKPIIK